MTELSRTLREFQLAPIVADWLRADGYEVWAEVPAPCSCSTIDLVGRKGLDIRIVELKTGWTDTLRRQGWRHLIMVSDVWTATPAKPRATTIQKFKNSGIGMLQIENGKPIVFCYPSRTHPVVEFLTSRLHNYLDHLPKGHDGGMPCLKGIGPAQECERAIEEYRKLHPNATWKEMYVSIPNHYSSYVSMRGAMRMTELRRRQP